MKKRRIVLITALAAVLLCSCKNMPGSGAFEPEESMIYVAGDGTLSNAVVEKYKRDIYTQAELQAFAEQAVNEYNAESGKTEKAVTLNSCVLEDGTAKLIFDYDNGEDLINFSSENEDSSNSVKQLYVASFQELIADGSINEGELFRADNGKRISNESISKKDNLLAVKTEGVAKIQTGSKILYVTNNVQKIDKHTVKTSEEVCYIIFKQTEKKK